MHRTTLASFFSLPHNVCMRARTQRIVAAYASAANHNVNIKQSSCMYIIKTCTHAQYLASSPYTNTRHI